MNEAVAAIDPQLFRETLGHYPTGVVVVTALNVDREPEGLVIGSFSSVSLDPPLVAYLPMKSSFTYGKIREAEIFCINILAHDQLDLCRSLARGGPEKFDSVDWRPSPGGAPILAGAVAWIECRRGQEVEAGDHFIALGEVLDLRVERPVLPLLFFQGGYGRFTSSSMQLSGIGGPFGDSGLPSPLLGAMDDLAGVLSCEVHLMARQGDDVVLAAVASRGSRSSRSFVGARVPLAPPVGTAFAAFGPEREGADWIARLGRVDEDARAGFETLLSRTRERGWSIVLAAEYPEDGPDAFETYSRPDRTPADERRFRAIAVGLTPFHEPELEAGDAEYAVRWIEVPVLAGDGPVAYSIRLEGLPAAGAQTIRGWAESARAVAELAASELSAS